MTYIYKKILIKYFINWIHLILLLVIFDYRVIFNFIFITSDFHLNFVLHFIIFINKYIKIFMNFFDRTSFLNLLNILSIVFFIFLSNLVYHFNIKLL